MNKTLQILSSLVGIVFLISGIGKAITTYEFSQILSQYGFSALRFFAPIIIVFETAIGLLLFLNIRLKQTSLLALCFVAALSLAYLYGYFFADITDCGCFGHFSFLDASPFFTCIRNLILMGILLYTFLKSSHLQKPADKNENLIITSILCAVCLVTGYTFVDHNKNENTQYITEGKNVNIKVENSVFSEFLTLSKDSTYLIFTFSYGCPHCYNSIENLKQYERLGVVDRVLALSFTADSATIMKFNEIFNPNFQIKNYPPAQLFQLTNQFPTSYYIKDNIVRMRIHGLLPSGYLLQYQLDEIGR